MSRRNIVQIDQQKCDGCGLCVPACAEGAIQIIEGKARLVSDTYCDGLGACLGHCPQGAITIIEREAEAFDEKLAPTVAAGKRDSPIFAGGELPQCPGTKMGTIPQPGADQPGLSNWPVQLHLVPPTAPFLQGADVLLVADCVPVAFADFHHRFVGRRPVIIGCPKLDDANAYVQKLARMIAGANIRSLTVVHMEVPCCLGLVRIAQAAMGVAGRQIPLEEVTISIRGRMISPAP